jgi:tetratricopeptide (TPR) repeat protein
MFAGVNVDTLSKAVQQAVNISEEETAASVAAASAIAFGQKAKKAPAAPAAAPAVKASRKHIECDQCGKADPRARCANCRRMYYCNAACQKLHWADHKCDCRSLSEMRCTRLGFTKAQEGAFSSQNASAALAAESTDCGVCLGPIISPVVHPACGHAFCYPCLQRYQTVAPSNTLWSRKEPGDADPAFLDGQAATCPSCLERGEAAGTGKAVLERAALHCVRAEKFATPAEKRAEAERGLAEVARLEREVAGAMQLEEAEKLPEDIAALVLRSDLCAACGDLAAALAHVERALEVNESRELAGDATAVKVDDKATDANEMLESLEKDKYFDPMSERGRAADAELQRRIEEMESTSSEERKKVTFVESALVDAQLRRAAVLEALAGTPSDPYGWDAAAKAYQELLARSWPAGCVEASCSPTQMQAMYSGISRCCLGGGNLEGAVEFGHAAIEMNRSLPGVHRHVALAEREIGELDAAVRTASRAVLHEAPWDEENLKAAQATLETLTGEQMQERAAKRKAEDNPFSRALEAELGSTPFSSSASGEEAPGEERAAPTPSWGGARYAPVRH